MFSNDQRKTFVDSYNDGFCAMLVYCMLYKVLQSYDRCTMRHSQYIQNKFIQECIELTRLTVIYVCTSLTNELILRKECNRLDQFSTMN